MDLEEESCRRSFELDARPRYAENVNQSRDSEVQLGPVMVAEIDMNTFAILARRYDRIRNLNLSSSVCTTTRENDVPASIRAVRSSIVSILLSRTARC